MFRNLLPSLRREQSGLAYREDPFTEMMERFFRSPFEGFPREFGDFPSIDLSETDKDIVVKAEMPGMEPEDIDLSVEGGSLIIKGEKKRETEDHNENYHRIERSYGSFYRTIALPSQVDEANVKANFKRGVLQITLPKKENTQGKKIAIET
ncbi:Hsp20/alpha crystallin family protein [Desulfohalobium retbaense]|uniref:Heat shock protein Hsp20 n=1 Tax=Desulfohalobium retbaense (strain ATCC 49708 / DSM 5692 / JCM 16813 / HR100) TaxID=485915 RepID=C8X0F3_DESRD|nr:Hsp20/alpha crystallin family protein [Desulfohalobium retbaense]ACV67778.1 heat shock protein Hsp20 [Desulfohalobium retbaense DSM 5692]